MIKDKVVDKIKELLKTYLNLDFLLEIEKGRDREAGCLYKG